MKSSNLGLKAAYPSWGTVDLCVDLPKFWFENDGMVSGSWGNGVGNGEMEGAEGCFSCSERGISVCRGVVGWGKGQ